MPAHLPPFRFGSRQRSVGPRTREVKAWVRQGSSASAEATIVVTELSCSEPGCPPVEVVMAVMEPGQAPLQRKLHRRLEHLSRDEVIRLWQAEGGDRHHDHDGEHPEAKQNQED